MLVVLLISAAGLIISILTAWLIFGIGPGEADLWQETLTPGYINYFKYLQAIQHLSMFLIPSLAIGFLMKGDAYTYLGLKDVPGLTPLTLSILFIIFIIPLNSYLSWFNAGLDLPGWLDWLEKWMLEKEAQTERLTAILMDTATVGALLVNLIIVVLIPAVGEEFLYRGILQNIFTEWLKSGTLAVVLTAILFSAAHLQFYGFLPRLILGLGFGFIYLWSEKLWLPIIAHLVNNLIPLVLSYFMGWENINGTMDEFSSGDGLLVAVPALIALLILLIIRREGLRGT